MTTKKQPWEEMRMFDMGSVPDSMQAMVAGLERWWMEHAANEAAQTIPKAVEYGSSSLTSVGDMIKAIAPQLKHISSQELAVTFYVFGKMARILAALERGEQPGIDHWDDIRIYGKMISYIRENGSWV